MTNRAFNIETQSETFDRLHIEVVENGWVVRVCGLDFVYGTFGDLVAGISRLLTNPTGDSS